MAIEVHKEPLYRRYYSKICSWAFMYIVVVWFLIIFLPLIIAYNSSNFWLKENVIYEQPKIDYKYQFILEAYGNSISGELLNIFYSTSPTINQLYNNNLRIPSLSSIEYDDNKDGKTDRLEINYLLPLSLNESLSSFSAICYHNVEISSKARYYYDAMTYIAYSSAMPISTISMDGNLILTQTWPFNAKGGFKAPYSEDPLLTITSELSAEDVSISNIMRRNNARNFSLIYQPKYQYSERNVLHSSNSYDTTQNYFNVSIIMRIPEQAIRYTPPPSELLKYSWIQYVAYLIVIAFLLNRLNSFVFRSQIIYTYPVADVILEKMD